MKFFFAVLSALLYFGTTPTEAAEIELRPDLKPYLRSLTPIYDHWGEVFDEKNSPGEVHVITYSGPVEQGDTAKLQSLVKGFPGFGSFFVVFNSPGGNFIEGIKLGQFLQQFRGGNDISQLVGVAVLQDNGCYSACAVAFTMAVAGEDAGNSARYIEVGADLGFHMPYYPKELGDQLSVISDTLNVGYDLVLEFSKIVSGGVSPIELLQMSLLHRSATFFTLKGGLLSRYMGFAPVSRNVLSYPLYADGLTMEQVGALCANLHFTRSDLRLTWLDVEGYEMDFGQYSPWPEGTTLNEAVQLLRSPRLLSYFCAVEVRNDNSVGIHAREFTEQECVDASREGDWCPAIIDEYTELLPNATVGQLANVFDCNLGQLLTEFHYWGYPLTFDQEERGVAPTQLDRGIVVARKANLRSRPDLNASVVGQVRAGDNATIRDCQVQGDSQGVWTRVDTQLGSGWVSSRYLYNAYYTRSLQRVTR